MLVGDLRGKWRECDPFVTSEMISSAPQTEASLKTSTQVLYLDRFSQGSIVAFVQRSLLF